MIPSDNVRFPSKAGITFSDNVDGEMKELIQSLIPVASGYVNHALEPQIEMSIDSAIASGEGTKEELEPYKFDATFKKIVGGAMLTAFINATLLAITKHAETVAETDCWMPPTKLPGRDALVVLAFCNPDKDPVPVDIALGDYNHDTQEFIPDLEEGALLTPGVKLVAWKWAEFGPKQFNAMYPDPVGDDVAHVQRDNDIDSQIMGENGE